MNSCPLPLAQYFGVGLSAGLLIAATPNTAFSDENCQRLEALAIQYAGVRLSSEQKQLKRSLVDWYETNCGRRRGSN